MQGRTYQRLRDAGMKNVQQSKITTATKKEHLVRMTVSAQ
jgi:hypothetical protein